MSAACDDAAKVGVRNPYAKKSPASATQTNDQQLNQQKYQQQSLNQMIMLRDSKRQHMTKLFDKLQVMIQQRKELDEKISSTEKDMEDLENELMELDDDIDIMEQNQQQGHPTPLPDQHSAHNCNQQSNNGTHSSISSEYVGAQAQRESTSCQPMSLTMNPDEHLPEPLSATQKMTQTQAMEEEFLTDPGLSASTQLNQLSPRKPAAAVQSQQQGNFHEPHWDEDPYWAEEPEPEEEPPPPFESTKRDGFSNRMLPELDIITTADTAKRKATPTSSAASNQHLDESLLHGSEPKKKKRGSVGIGTLDHFIVTAPPANRKARLSTGTATTAASTPEPTDLTMGDVGDFDDARNSMLASNPQRQFGAQPFSVLPPPQSLQQHRSSNVDNFFPWSQQQVYDLLKQRFKIHNFRDQQEAIIESTLRGRDTFVIMRTGGGKLSRFQF